MLPDDEVTDAEVNDETLCEKEDVTLYLESIEQRFNEKVDALTNKSIGTLTPKAPECQSIQDIWNYAMALEARIDERLNKIKENRIDFSIGENLINSIPGGSPSVKKVVTTSRRTRVVASDASIED